MTSTALRQFKSCTDDQSSRGRGGFFSPSTFSPCLRLNSGSNPSGVIYPSSIRACRIPTRKFEGFFPNVVKRYVLWRRKEANFLFPCVDRFFTISVFSSRVLFCLDSPFLLLASFFFACIGGGLRKLAGCLLEDFFLCICFFFRSSQSQTGTCYTLINSGKEEDIRIYMQPLFQRNKQTNFFLFFQQQPFVGTKSVSYTHLTLPTTPYV